MTEVKNIEIMPPEIITYFQSNLLSRPMLRCGDDCEFLWKIYQYIKRNLERRRKQPNAKFSDLEKQFLEVYERAKAKEEEIERATGDKGQRSFGCFIRLDKSDRKTFDIIRRAAIYR